MKYESDDWKRLLDKPWREWPDADKRRLILINDLYGKLNELMNIIESTHPDAAREIEQFKKKTLDPLALPDPADGDEGLSDEEAADREALERSLEVGRS